MDWYAAFFQSLFSDPLFWGAVAGLAFFVWYIGRLQKHQGNFLKKYDHALQTQEYVLAEMQKANGLLAEISQKLGKN